MSGHLKLGKTYDVKKDTHRNQRPITKEVDKSRSCAVDKRWGSKNRSRHPCLDCEFRISLVHPFTNGPQGLVDSPHKR